MQIKIRAWDKTKKQMHEVLVIDWLNCLVDLDYSNIERPWYGNDDERSEVILMMYTGLKDKDGVEIYEGDVLKGRFMFTDVDGESSIHTSVGVVRWAENSGRWVVDGEVFRGEDLAHWNVGELCILGNIYENPELMERKE